MNKLITILLLSVGWTYGATSPNIMLDWSKSPVGALTTATLSNAIVGTINSAYMDANPARWYVENTNGNTPAFPSTITINGTNWTGVSANWLVNNCNAGSGYNYINVIFPGGADATTTNAMVCGFIQCNVTNTPGDHNLDQWILNKSTIYGDFAVMQIVPTNASVSLHVHDSLTSGSSANLAVTNLTFGQSYFVMLIQDAIAQTSTVRLYSPTSPFTLLASGTVSSDNRGGASYWLQMPSGYLGDLSGTISYGPMLIFLSPTAAQIDGVITNAVTTNAVSAAYGDVTNSIAVCPEGGTVHIPAGTVILTDGQFFNVPQTNISIVGAGSDQTVYVWGHTGDVAVQAPFHHLALGGGYFGLSGIGFYGYTNTAYGAINMRGNSFFRIHDCYFRVASLSTSAYGINFSPSSATRQPWGVVDHCQFYFPSNASGAAMTLSGMTNTWHTPFTYGTTNTIMVEDCTFAAVTSGGNSGVFDCYNGGHFAVRSCTMSNMTDTLHGCDTGGRSTRAWEFYSNNWTSAFTFGRALFIRGGSGVVHHETVVAGYQHLIDYFLYRADWNYQASMASQGWNMVTGANPMDGNFDANGYPPLDNVGAGSFPVGSSWDGVTTVHWATNQYQTIEGAYQWSNSFSGTNPISYVQAATTTNGTYATPPDLIKSGLNYFDNAAKAGYTTLVYPHPLVGPPAAVYPPSATISGGATITGGALIK